MIISRVCLLVCTGDDRLFAHLERLLGELGVRNIRRFDDIVEARRAAALILDRALIYDSRKDSEGMADSRCQSLRIYSGLSCLYICEQGDVTLTEENPDCFETTPYPVPDGELSDCLLRLLYRASLELVGRMPRGASDEDDFVRSYAAGALARLRVRPGTKGCLFLTEAIREAVFEPSLLGTIGVIYKRVAERFSTSEKNVERLIRYAVMSAWERGGAELKACIFAGSIRPDGWQAPNASVIRVYSRLIRAMLELSEY